MASAGFTLTAQPGIYLNQQGVQVDLLVPERLGGRRGRGAALGVHGNTSARQVRGLQGALVCNAPSRISSLTPADPRSYEIRVAGPASLVVAKVHKIVERIDAQRRDRSLDKDAFDVFRLLRAVDTRALAEEFGVLLSNEVSHEVTSEALAHLQQLFGSSTGEGTLLALRHVATIEPAETIGEATVILTNDLLRLLSTQNG